MINFGIPFNCSSEGINFMCCPIEYVADKVSMRIQQLEIKCETKTLDNVFVNGMIPRTDSIYEI